MDEKENNQFNGDMAKEKNCIPYTAAAGAKLPKRAKAVDLRGEKIGKVRKSVLKDGDDRVLGKFSRDEENDMVFFYSPDENGEPTNLAGYVDKNNNLLTLENDYVATLKYHTLAIIIIPLLCLLAALTAFSIILCSYYLSRSRDYIPTIFITEDGGSEWIDDEYIDVFENGKYNGNKIHPGMEGEYLFRFENRNANRLNYNMTFTEENEYSMNMGYRLRFDNVYVLGNEDTYISIDELKLEDAIIASGSSAIFTLEWKWIDGTGDTEAGMNEATYTLHITLDAQTTAYIN